MNLRVPVATFFFLSIVLFPWWVSVVAAIALTFLSEGFEVVVGGFLADVLYATAVPSFHGFMFIMTAGALALFFTARVAKRYLIHYPRTL